MVIRQNRLSEAVLTSTHNLCFEQKYEKHQNFLSENFHILLVKIAVYLNRLVFVMRPPGLQSDAHPTEPPRPAVVYVLSFMFCLLFLLVSLVSYVL